MNKKLIAIIAVVAAILIIAVVAIVVGSNDKSVSLGQDGGAVGNSVDEDDIDESNVSGAIEDSIFDDGSSDKSGYDSSRKDKESSNSNSDSASSSDNGGQDNQSTTVKPGEKIDYATFYAMSPADQQEYMESFKDIDKFFNWYNKAKKQYEKDHPSIEIDGGPVELQ